MCHYIYQFSASTEHREIMMDGNHKRVRLK